jgi:hypothetical protein
MEHSQHRNHPKRLFVIPCVAFALVLGTVQVSSSADAPVPDFPRPDAAIDGGIDAILARRVDISLVDVPWPKAMATLAREYGLPVRLDPEIVTRNLDLNRNVTRVTRGTRLKTAVENILRDAGMLYEIRDGRLVITTLARGHARLEAEKPVWRSYSVGDLLRAGVPAAGLRRVLFATAFEPDDVEIDQDPPLILISDNALHVFRPQHAQPQIATALATIRRHFFHRGPQDDATRVTAILEKPVTMHCERIPLNQFAARLQDLIHTAIVLDVPTLDDASIPLDSEVSCDVAGISLRSLLFHVLGSLPQPLEAVVREDELCITTAEAANQQRSVRVYDVRGMTPAHFFPMSNFATIIQRFAGDENSWAEIDWPDDRNAVYDRAQILSGMLIVRQSEDVHQDLAHLLRLIRRAGAYRPADVPLTRAEVREAQLRAALDQRTSVPTMRLPLKSLMRWLRDRYDLPIAVDQRSLEDASVDLSQDVDFAVDHETLREGLQRALATARLAVSIDHEMILLSTQEKINSLFEVEVFPAWRLLPRHASDVTLLRRIMADLTKPRGDREEGEWIEEGNSLLVRSGFVFFKHTPDLPHLNFNRLASDDGGRTANTDEAAALVEEKWQSVQNLHARTPRRPHINP